MHVHTSSPEETLTLLQMLSVALLHNGMMLISTPGTTSDVNFIESGCLC